jgi:Family of unknown function (DUF6182)
MSPREPIVSPSSGSTPMSALDAMARRIDACRAFAGDAERAELAQLERDVQLALVLRSLDVAALVRGTIALCRALPVQLARRWVGNFTKCVVLVGEPRKLTRRFAFSQITDDGGAAWIGPASAADLESARRLLRPLQTRGRPSLHDATLAIDPPPAHEAVAMQWPPPAVLTLATEDVPLEEYLVSLLHTVAEGVLLGHLSGASAVALQHVPFIDYLSSSMPYARVRKGTSSDASLRICSTIAPHGPHVA